MNGPSPYNRAAAASGFASGNWDRSVPRPFVRISPRFPRCCAQVEKGKGDLPLFSRSSSFISCTIDETNYYSEVKQFSFHLNWLKNIRNLTYEFRCYHSISNCFHFTLFFVAFFPRPRKSKKKALKREEVLPFRSNWREQQTRRREWPGLTAFSRASCAYALSLGARNALSRMPAYYYGVGHRACSRVSLSRRKATDQVNIANRCIVASVNSISRPTDPAWLRSLPLSHPRQPVTINPRFSFVSFFRVSRRKIPSNRSWIEEIYKSFIVPSSIRKLRRSN